MPFLLNSEIAQNFLKKIKNETASLRFIKNHKEAVKIKYSVTVQYNHRQQYNRNL